MGGRVLLAVVVEREAGGDVHGLQFGEEQFARVRHGDGGDVAGALAAVAPAAVAEAAALVAHVHLALVARHHQSFH